MKAARLHAVGNQLEIDDIPVPEPRPGEVLVEVKSAGICGSDLHIIGGVTPLPEYPMTLGHEMAGVVVELGEGVNPWKTGDKVCVNSLISCGSCLYCRMGRESLCLNRQVLGVHLPGGYAQYVRVPQRNLVKLADNLSFAEGALLTDAVATPFHAIAKRSGLRMGDTVAVFGVGGLGIHAVQLLKLGGAGHIIAVDVSDGALARARTVGAGQVINARTDDPVKAIRELTSGRGCDIALDVVGRAVTATQAVESVCPGGRAVIVGLGDEVLTLLPNSLFVRSEIEVVGSYAFDQAEIVQLVNLAASKILDLSASITDIISLEQVNEGMVRLERKIGDPVRITVDPSHSH